MNNDRENLQIIRDLTYKLTLRDEDVFRDHRLFHLLQNSTGDGYWDWDLREGVKYMSTTYKEQLGYTAEEIENHFEGDHRLICDESLDATKKNLDDHFTSHGKIPYSSIIRYTHKKGHTVWILCRGAVVSWDGDEPVRMVGTHVNITESIEKIKNCCNG
jgi:PAS domain S-box-containing protein